jgi:hypothetical protein
MPLPSRRIIAWLKEVEPGVETPVSFLPLLLDLKVHHNECSRKDAVSALRVFCRLESCLFAIAQSYRASLTYDVSPPRYMKVFGFKVLKRMSEQRFIGYIQEPTRKQHSFPKGVLQ